MPYLGLPLQGLFLRPAVNNYLFIPELAIVRNSTIYIFFKHPYSVSPFQVLDVTPEDISQGYTVFMAVTDDDESISDEDFRVERGDLTQEPEATQAQATLFIPSGLADRFSGRRGRLVITTYRVPSLFQDTGIAQFNQDVEENNRTLNSRIISASINNEKVEDLSEPVRISFTPLNPVRR